ncbi:MAG: hypothetical protein DI556_21235 [Rhodovulum sulfidophilum]|uniref:Uncharacterized protein n=1 Tax=Rhodovulum sulfidophilum TaxID=35806 RepID=A0A2W5PUG8_RHOSU|nr:MAG: hypothetical protein DI556_21235 [Rhodovulum sulfidophilum]
MKIIATTAIALSLGLGLIGSAPAWAVGGSFACERPPIMEVTENVEGSSALQSIVNQYRERWDAEVVARECEAYAAGEPYEISCLNGRRDWPTILASVPPDYFGRSNKSLASTVDTERRVDSGYKAAIAYCRSVGAIK